MKYWVDGENALFLFENEKLDCCCVIAKNTKFDLPGLGGTRFIFYNDLSSAIADATALSNNMLLKNMAAQLPFTGAKQVIFCRNQQLSTEKRNDILSFSAECVNQLHGQFITGTDMGISAEDVSLMAVSSPYILHSELGNTSDDTAIGVTSGLYHMMPLIFSGKKKSDLRVLVQGLGKVGSNVVDRLRQEEIQVVVSDIDHEKARRVCEANNAEFLSDITHFRGDVFMPCASEKWVSHDLAQKIEISIVAGAANNQLLSLDEDFRLFEAGIFYAPDFVINSGGTIHAAAGYLNWSDAERTEKLMQIPLQLQEIYDYAQAKSIGTYQAAKEYVWANTKSSRRQ